MNIDLIIVIGFLITNLGVGIFSGRGINTIKEYAIGNRNFSTATIAATIIATWISGDFFTVAVSDTYKEGIWFAFAGGGDIVALLIIGRVLGPKMKEFFGSLSVAEVMGNIFGKNIRIVTAIASIAHAVGVTSLQIKVFSVIFSHFLGVSSIYATFISSIVVIVYSTFGGIKAVTFTDVIQFFTFGVFIPLLALFIWQIFGSGELIMHTLETNKAFDYNELFNYKNPNFFPYLLLFVYCAIPSFNSTLFQRTLMAKNTRQITQSFTIAGIVSLIIHLFACFIGLVVLSHDPNLNPDNATMYVIDNYSFVGLKGIALVGIMAMIMSTADSWINTASVIFAHDLCAPLGLKFKNELIVSRIFAMFVGILSVFMTLSTIDISILQMYLLKANFYKPIVTVPLILAILGFRSSTKAVAIGMFTGGLWALVWKINITPVTGIDSVIPAMAMNLIAYMGSHYMLAQPGGWIKSNKPSINKTKARNNKKIQALKDFINYIPNFALINYCKTKTPKNEIIYTYFSFGTMFSIVTTFSLDRVTYQENVILINVLEIASLFISMIFLCRNLLWTKKFKEKYIGLIWHIAIFVSFAFISSLLVLISKFSQISLIVFILNLTMIGLLLSWQVTLLMIISGITLAFYSYKFYIGNPISTELFDLKLKIIYVVLLISSFMLAFLKPRQEHQKLTEEKNEHLEERIGSQEKQLNEALALKGEFIRNINHEYHAPMVGVISLAQVLSESYDKLNDEQRKNVADDIFKSAIRLESFDANITSLSKLSKGGYELKLEQIDLSELLNARVKICRKLYEEEKENREFILNIDDEISLNADKYYLIQALDNLIINAITYCSSGQIHISLKLEADKIIFNIKDEGIGIPIEELGNIFSEFTVSSKTRTPAGGRGIGLTLCKRITEVHGGTIKAKSDGTKGAEFTVILPVK